MANKGCIYTTGNEYGSLICKGGSGQTVVGAEDGAVVPAKLNAGRFYREEGSMDF